MRDFHPRPGADVGVVADVLSRFVPEQRDLLYLSFALADANRLEHMLVSAGFRDVRWNECDAKIRSAVSTNIGTRSKPE
jgi:hypothetical protein